jgi:hypothetical protein
VLGLTWKHVSLDAGTIQIEQRVWHQDVGRPKSDGSKRVLGIGDLVERYAEKAADDDATPDSFVFQEKRAPGKPLWDSGVRDALHHAAQAEHAISKGSGPIRFAAPISHGRNRSAAVRSRHPRLQATAISRRRANILASAPNGKMS